MSCAKSIEKRPKKVLRDKTIVVNLVKLSNIVFGEDVVYFVRMFTKLTGTNDISDDRLVSKDPISLFKEWFDEARGTKDIKFPNAFCLATCSKDCIPSARFVILSGFSKSGFNFFTYYESRKGKEIAENPNVAATFYWEVLNRQVRIEGSIEKVSEAESKEYFSTMPPKIQVATKASVQSTAIESKDIVLQRVSEIEDQYVKAGKEIPKPEGWGGYVIRPSSVEFWQGQRTRLADRVRFRRPHVDEVADGKLVHRGEDGWVYERLSP